MLPVISHHSQLCANVYPELFALVCISHVTNGKDYKILKRLKLTKILLLCGQVQKECTYMGRGRLDDMTPLILMG